MDSIISDNDASGGDGGGIYIATGGDVDDSGGLVSGNTAGSNGGGVYNDNATYTVRNKWFYENEATGGSGGGVYVTGDSSVLDLINALFDDNTAQVDGGGLYRTGNGSAALYHNTIHQNTAQTGQGGGVYNAGSSMVISASIVASNIAATGTYSGVQGTAQIAYTLRWNNGIEGFTPGSNGNKDGDPRFNILLPSPAVAYLSYSSPAIDAVPTSASHIERDAYLDPRPQICDKDMGLDEYAVGVRGMSWVAGGPFPQQSATLTPTASFTYTFPLRNDSENWLRLSDSDTSLGPGTGYTETITVTLNSSRGWAEIVGIVGGASSYIQPGGQAAAFAIGPGQVVSIEVKVTVPAGAYATDPDDDSTKEFTSLTYQARQCPGDAPMQGTSYAAETWVEMYRDFVIAPDNFGAALPGQTVTYTHIITNLGNITDTYTIVPKNGFYGSGQIAQPVPSEITLGPLQTSTVVISVTISSAAAGGLPIPDTTSVIAIASDGIQKSAGNNTVISFTTGTRYVSLDGDDSVVDESELTGENYQDNNCTQPLVGACRTIQQAIDQAADGDMIKVDQGVYSVVYTDVLTVTYKSQVLTQTAFVDKSVTLQGGYDRDNWDEDPPSHISQTTTLDPQNQGRAIYVTEDVTATIARLTIVNGSAAGQGGGPGSEDAGGNIYNEGGNLTLNANRIYSSTADIGGGLYHGGSDLLLQNNLLHGNQVISQGGAIYIYTGNATLQNNTLYNNSATQEGSAVYVDGGNFVVTNTIFANNTGSGGAVHGSPATTSLDYNLYHSNTVTDTGGLVPPPSLPNDVLADPQFVNPSASPPDLHLQSGSSARDTGDPDTNLNIDYDNDFRPLGLGYDIGADERVPMRGLLFYSDNVTDTLAGTTVVFTHTLQNSGDITETVTLTSTSTQNWDITFAPSLPYTVTLGVGGSLTMTVTITVPSDANGLTNVTTITATSSLTPVLVATVQDTVHAMSAEWEISKAVTPAITVRPGEYLTCTLTITNSGDLDTSGVYTITDELPTYTHFITATPPPVLTDPVTWVSSDTVGIGEVITRTFVVTVSRPLTDGTPIVNQTYSVVGGGAYTQAMGVPVTVTVDAPASLNITKTVSADPVQPGDYLTYTITITNADSALGPALNALVSDTLPANAVYQSMGFVTPTTGIFTATGDPLLLWQLANPIPVDGSAQVTATVRVTSPLASGTILTNTYGVTATNSVYVSGTIATPVTSTNSITLSKAVEPTRVIPGGTVTYTITLTNSGNGVATAALTDVLDSAFSPQTYITNVTVPGRTWDTTEGVATVSFTATAPASVGIYYNQWITATYDLTQTAISHIAPVTVRICWARLNNEPTIYPIVQAGVDASTQPTDVVKVAGYCAGVETREGVTQTVYISKTLTVRGGYTTTNWTTSDPVANPTTLDALSGGRVLYVTGDISPTIEGLRITSGDADGLGGDPWGDDLGGGVYVISATPTISNNLIFSNTADIGGGLYLAGSDATLSGNAFSDNTADHCGGGLHLEDSDAMLISNTITANISQFGNGGGLCVTHGSDATLSGNTVSGNDAHTSGGGIYSLSSNAVFIANAFNGNTAGSGGGLHLEGGNVTLSANTVVSNTAFQGGGLFLEFHDVAMLSANTIISNTASGTFWAFGRGGGLYLQMSDATLTNNVVADNRADNKGSGLYIVNSSTRLLHTTIARNSGDGSGMYVYGVDDEEMPYSTVTLTNTILVSHSVGISVTGGNTVTVNSILWHNTPITVSQATTATVTVQNQYQGDPAFAADGYHLTAGSAAIDQGVAAGVPADIDGQSRPAGAYPDLGADEFPAGLSVIKEADPDPVHAGTQLTYTITITNTGVVDLTATITDTLPAHVTPTGALTWAPTITAPGGVWMQTVVVTVELGYAGTLTNVVEVTTDEGATGIYTETSEVLGIPMLIAPPDGTITNTQVITFEWSDTGAPAYTIDLNDTFYTVTTRISPTVLSDGIYTWTVASVDGLGRRGVFTDAWTVTVDLTPPSVPTPTHPLSDTVMTTSTVPFTWTASSDNLSGVVSYTIMVSGPTPYSDTVPVGNITSTDIVLNGDGIYTWTVQAIDAAGNPSGFSSPVTFTVDATAPDRPFLIAPPNGTLTNTQAITLVWSRVDQAITYTLYLTPTGAFDIADPGSGTTVVSPTVLAEGVYTWTVAAIDSFGRTNGFTETWIFTIDTTPPLTPTLIAPPDGTLITNTTVVTFEWTSISDAASYNLRITKSVTQVITYSVSTHTQPITLIFGNGVYSWTVEAVDAAGNHSGYTSTWTLNLQGPPPRPTLIAPPDGTLTNTLPITFEWTAVPGGVTYTLHLSDSLPAMISDTTYVTDVVDGVYTWTVEALNIASVSSGITDTWVFTVDTTAPSTPTLITPISGTLLATDTVAFNWTEPIDNLSGVLSYTLSVSGQLPILTSTNAYTLSGLADGVYTWTVKAIDRIGNSSGFTNTWVFTIDTTPPLTPTLLTPPDGTLTNDPAITFGWSSVGPPSSITYTLNVSNTLYDVTTTTHIVTVTHDGSYTWTVKATDRAGNSTGYTATWTVHVDTTPPTTPTQISPVAPTVMPTSTVSFTWTTSSDNFDPPFPISYTVLVTGPTPYSNTVTVGSITSTDIILNGDGIYTWTVQAIDAAGNPSGFSSPVTFTVDAIASDRPFLIAPPNGTLTNTQAITLVWSRVDQTVMYTLQLTPTGTFDIADPGSGATVVSPTVLAEGVYTWTVAAIDSFGRTSGFTETWVFTIDTTPPTSPTLLVPPDGAAITDTSVITFEWTASSDALSGPVTYTLSISGQPPQVLSGTTVTLTLGDGAYTWTVWATDRAGNSAYTDTLTFEVDATPPDRPTLLSPPNQTYTNSTNVTFTWSSTADAVTYTLNVNGFLYPVTVPSTSQGFIGLSEGIYSWTVRSVDAYSRTLGYTDTWRVTVDVTPPASPTLISPPSGAVISTTARPTFDWSDVNDALSGPVTYTITIGNVGTFETATSDFTPGSDLPYGAYTWTVHAYDRAGNVSSSSESFTLTIESGAPASDIYLPIILRNYTSPPPPSGPDLVVTGISVVPNPPGAGQSATVYVTVRNQGNRAVAYGNNFYVDFYVDRAPAPFLVGDIQWGAQGSWFGAGESRTFSSSHTFTSGSHQLYAQADSDNTVIEANEGNNVLGPVPLNVTGLGGGEAPVAPAVTPTPGVGGPRPTPTPEP